MRGSDPSLRDTTAFMPDDARVQPLASDDIQRLLQGIFATTESPLELALEAFAVTAASLYGWCNPVDIDRALSMLAPVMPTPRCLHGNHWKQCPRCPRA